MSKVLKRSLGKFVVLCTILIGYLAWKGEYSSKFINVIKDKSKWIRSEEQPMSTLINRDSVRRAESIMNSDGLDVDCLDEVWCGVPMPKTSHFKFEPPVDAIRWKRAQLMAASNELVLLQRISKVLTHPLDFLDGDRQFRSLHHIVDVFVDGKKGITDLTKFRKKPEALGTERRLMLDSRDNPGKYVPPNYDFIGARRAPVVQIGFGVFKKDSNTYFAGDRIGYSGIDKYEFFRQWAAVKDDIDTPFIAMCQGNENWGMLSTMFPNRTAKWGACCNKPRDKELYEFLNHDKTLMLVINQHSNISHPKLLTVPRGLPLTWMHTPRLIWDSMRISLQDVKKDKLLFAASSNWGKRPQILRCISNKMPVADFEGHSDAPKNPAITGATKRDRGLYYRKLASARFGLALPGLGYDCFRTWELMTLGSIIIIERGVGLDRTLWRLPALLVDDFDDINPTLLRSAYVEAMYRADEFEYERLKQSFWWNVIANVSASKSTAPMLEKFPMEAEDPDFTRPRDPFTCDEKHRCGRGTKTRTPKNSC